MSDIFIQSFTHLKDMYNADKALHTLKRIASLVKPIMRKRRWVLPVLAEFFPDSPNLLGACLLLQLQANLTADAELFLLWQDLVGIIDLC